MDLNKEEIDHIKFQLEKHIKSTQWVLDNKSMEEEKQSFLRKKLKMSKEILKKWI